MNTKKLSALLATKVRFVEPMYARLVQNLPEGEDWLYEIKFDGYRCLASKSESGVTLWSCRGNLFTAQFPRIAAACKLLSPETLIDGELVALDATGRVSFNMLQHHRSRASAIRYYVFDLMIYRGKSLLGVPLTTRRELLVEALRDVTQSADSIRLSETLDARPGQLIEAAKELQLEGIVAKRKDSSYESGKRSGAWVKYKINKSQDFVIGGYAHGNPLDALIVGYYDGDRLIYAAKVRNGFVPAVRRDVWKRLKDLRIDGCPFANLPEKKRTQWALTAEEMKNCVWLEPKMVAEIEFTEWTPDGHLRHSRFVTLREDKDPREVVREH